MKIHLLLLLFLLPVTHAKTTTSAFRWGVGGFSLMGNHYRGSDQTKVFYLPMPYFSYRDETIEAETSFVRGAIYKSQFFDAKISLMAGLAVDSEGNQAREGMPDLDYTFELGPLLIWKFWKSSDKKQRLNIEWPIRQVFSTDLSYVKDHGFFSIPYLNYILAPSKLTFNWHIELSVGPMFGSRAYHEYFYGVHPDFQRPNRPAYQPKSGYSGTQFAILMNRQIDKFLLIPFLRWDNLNGATFVDGPLNKSKNYFIGGLAMFYLFGP